MTKFPEIGRVAVIGAGTMGHGIAQVTAMAGCHVTLCDIDREALGRALDRVRANLEKGVARGKVAPETRDGALERLATSHEPATAVSGAQLVVEAVPESLELKRRVLAEAGRHAAPDALLATNTSSLPLAGLVDSVPSPGRFLGMHFFNPVHIMKLVEIVVADGSEPAAVTAARSFVARLGKEGIVVRDAPGFATSRLGLAIGLEAMRMVEEGVASAADIDKAMELGYNHPMGPLKLSDLVGLDVRLGIAETLARELDGTRFAPPEILRRLVSEGRLGKKSGAGFYRWTEQGPESDEP